MRLTILGSGTNLHPGRAAAGYLVRTDRTLLLDFGPRTLYNLIESGADRHAVTHILFSHFHADHFSDFITFFFDAVIHAKYEGGRRPDLTVIGPRGTIRLLKAIMATFPSFASPPFRVHFKEVDDRAFRIGDAKIVPALMTHVPDLSCVGYRIEYRGRSLVYSGDSQYCRNLVRLCREADLAVLDCSFPADRPGPAHMHAGQCGQVAQEAGVGKLILSHFYPPADHPKVKEQAACRFKGKIQRARDLLAVEL
jgi:ribonuclease BN (tRNA processing enzyme)